MAYININNSNSLHSCSSLGYWDLHNLGVLNADNISSYYTMDQNNVAPLMLPYNNMDHHHHQLLQNCCTSDFLSTGYLEDALIEFSLRFKRRRLTMCHDDNDDDDQRFAVSNFNDDLSYLSNWTANYGMQSQEEFSHASLLTNHDMHYSSGDTMEKSVKETREEAVNYFPAEMITNTHDELLLEEAISCHTPKLLEMSPPNSSTNCYSKYNSFNTNYTTTGLAYSSDTTYSTDSSSISDGTQKRKSKVVTPSSKSSGATKKMVYPFGLVKPGAVEGDITLKDINRRILMPPTRPLKHPVGDFACRPGVSPHGPGLSGKAVVALTRIHTQGRGTITIIRTKG